MTVALLRVVLVAAYLWSSALAASAQGPAAPLGPAATAAAAASPAEGAAAPTPTFSTAQLEQLAAPIALYPDSLLAQVLMASTYPLEIVLAARWLKANPKLEGDALLEALKDHDWDINVKALCGFRDVVARMDENIDWTKDLGDAFLAQRADLMDAVQRMRGKAYEAGNLKTTEQQVVTRKPDKIIVIESADPNVVYVPTYAPTVVYAGWSYPYWYYPPLYYPPAYGYGMVAFTAGVFWGAWLSGGCGWGWGGGDVDIDIDRNFNFDRNTNRNPDRPQVSPRGEGGRGKFQHNRQHRGGVNYRDAKTAQQFGGRDASRMSRDQARGFDRGAGGRDGIGATNRAATRPSARDGGLSSRSSVYSGSRNSSLDRASRSRGSMSRGGGGFSRGGGGMRGGGGRRR